MGANAAGTGWNGIEKPLYPWVRTIDRILHAQRLPVIGGPVINVFSDYGGEHKASSYAVTGVLYMDMEASTQWEARRRIVRRRYLSDGRRLSFKGLGDSQKRAALIPFLEAADEISGLCLVIAVRKSIVHLCSSPDIYGRFTEGLHFARVWKPKPFERMLRVSHLIGLLVAGLSRPRQSVYWFSDQDALFANHAITEDVRNMLGRFSSHYVRHELGELGIGTTAIDEGDRFEEDHVAVPDLLAGAVSEMMTKLSAFAGGRFPTAGIALPFSGRFSPKTEVIYSWLADPTRRLKRVVVVFEAITPSSFSVFKLDM